MDTNEKEAIVSPTRVNNPILGIDWEELRKQKQYLVSRQGVESNPTIHGYYEGLVNLLDSIQDYAVDTLGVDEERVFGKLED